MKRARLIPSLFLVAALTAIVVLVGPHTASADDPAQPPLLTTPTPVVETLHLDRNRPTNFAPEPADTQAESISASAVQVTTQIKASADAEILQGYPAANCGGRDALQIRAGYDTYQNPDGEVVRSLFQFNLPDIPPNATVQQATLELYVATSYDTPTGVMTATPRRITSPWYENAVTWSTQPNRGEAYGTASIVHNYPPPAQFDVTGLVQGWVDGSYANHGLAILGREFSPGWRSFATRNTSLPPELSLTYTFEPDYRLFVVPQRHTLRSGDSVSSVIYHQPIGKFDGSAALTVTGLPSGAGYTLDQTSLAPLDATVLHITTSAATPGGVYPFTVQGSSGGKVRTEQGVLEIVQPDFDLNVSPESRSVGVADEVAFTVSLTSIDEFDDPVTLAVGGLPASIESAWSQNPVQPTASVQLTLTTAADTPLGVYPCQITGTAGSLVHSVPFQITVSEPTFELLLAEPSQSVIPGANAQYQVTVSKVGEFVGEVSLAAGGLPAGATPLWSQNPVTPTADTTLTIQTTDQTPVGQHTFFLTGTHGLQTSSLSATLDVRPYTVYLPLAFKIGQTGAAALEPGAVSKIALLAGVSRYEEPGTITTSDDDIARKTKNLLHASDDPPGVRGELLRPPGLPHAASFDPQYVQMLLDSQASKGAIHDAIVNWIDPLEDEQTLVVLHFSGHGMYAPDDDGDEDDPYDELIVPFGIDVTLDPLPPSALDRAIRDDELAAWLDELESQKVVVLIDTCFSGGMTPSMALGRVKSLPGSGPSPDALSAQDLLDGFVQDIEQSGRVILMASSEGEYSIESTGLGHGVFTYFLMEALRSASADTNSNGWISAEEAFAYLRPKVSAYVQPSGAQQTPQMVDGVAGQADLTTPLTSVGACPGW